MLEPWDVTRFGVTNFGAVTVESESNASQSLFSSFFLCNLIMKVATSKCEESVSFIKLQTALLRCSDYELFRCNHSEMKTSKKREESRSKFYSSTIHLDDSQFYVISRHLVPINSHQLNNCAHKCLWYANAFTEYEIVNENTWSN